MEASLKMHNIGKIAGLLAATAIWSGAITNATAAFIFSGSGINPATGSSLAAQATFTTSGQTLTIRLENIGGDVKAPSDVLTALFWDPNATLTPVSAILADGSTVLFDSAPAGGVLGGEFAYASGLSGAPAGAALGVSSSGLNLFRGSTFPGPDLDPPLAVNGVNYGLTSAADNPLTGNAKVTGSVPLIQNTVEFTFTFTGTYNLESVHNVTFQYGTSLSEPHIAAVPVPEPTTIIAGALLLLPFGASTIRVLRRKA